MVATGVNLIALYFERLRIFVSMKVTSLTLSVSRRAAGMLDCVRRLNQEMQRKEGVQIDVLSLIDDQTDNDKASWEPLLLHLFSSRGPTNLAFAPAVADCLRELPTDLAHTFGLWTYLSQVTHSWSRRARKPYLVTPQGMLDPWALRNSRWRKRIVGVLYEYRHLRDAACIHATCQAELEAIRAFGLCNPVCVVPNGVDIPDDFEGVASALPWRQFVPEGRRVLLYLGRLHPKKGLASLLRAWAALWKDVPSKAEEWTLVVAGWDESDHAAQLKELVSKFSIEASVCFVGPLYGDDKAAAYRHADAFVLPSLSEGLPLVVLEAWSYRLPVVMTGACNLPEGFAADAALESGTRPEELATTLAKLIGLSDAGRKHMGERGRALVENRFTWSSAASKMAHVYRWVLGKAERPDFVFV
jgi:glycosyltransferase involved in cell wall biosynthesis